jgi:hypothetical protein
VRAHRSSVSAHIAWRFAHVSKWTCGRIPCIVRMVSAGQKILEVSTGTDLKMRHLLPRPHKLRM